MLDLYHATRDELIRIIQAQREALAAADARIAALERTQAELRLGLARLTTALGARSDGPSDDDGSRGTPTKMPGLKPTQAVPREPRIRKKRTHNVGRRRMTPTARITHALPRCPDCDAPLAGGSVKRTREVIDLPPPTVGVTEHAFLERRCPDCGKRCVPPPTVIGAGVGKRRVGPGLTSLIAVLREEARLPVALIPRLLKTLTGVHLSVGAVMDAVGHVAHRAQPLVVQFAQTIRGSPVVHADETGWREAGQNGYVWTFGTADTQLFRRGSRAKGMVGEVLGEAFAGVLVSDFYGAYTADDRLHQYCWAHLLRDIAELVEQHPEDETVRGWAVAVQAIFATAQGGAGGSPTHRRQMRHQAETQLRHLCTPWLDPRVPQTTLCARILRYLESLFVFVTESGVPTTNNQAERSLRHLVVSRKISGGTRSARGTATKMTVASLFGTWRARGLNPYLACLDLLTSPQL